MPRWLSALLDRLADRIQVGPKPGAPLDVRVMFEQPSRRTRRRINRRLRRLGVKPVHPPREGRR